MTFRNPRTCRRKRQKALCGSVSLPGKPWSGMPPMNVSTHLVDDVVLVYPPDAWERFGLVLDGDTYTDGEEYSTTRTSPVMSDSDNDGVIDNIELAYRSPSKLFTSPDEGAGLTVPANTATTFTKAISDMTAYGRVFSATLGLKCTLACNAQYTLKCYDYKTYILRASFVLGTFNNPDMQIDLLSVGFVEQSFRWHPANRFELVIDVTSPTAKTGALTYFRMTLVTMPDPTDKNSDQWGLYDGQELLDGTDPTNPLDDEIDTDGDGLSDPLENEYFSVGDIDWDGHSNGMWDPDTDGDGVGDGDELYPSSDNTRSGTYSSFSATDPADEDTDDDELHDGEEITYFTNPNSKHSDKDGLKDGYEINVIGTQPLDIDSDNDSLLDGWNDTNVNGFYETGEGWGEIGDITKGGLGGYGTDVGLNDTDDDDIDDGPESWFWLSRSYSEQQIKDDELISDSKYSDSDSWSDGKEILKYYTEPSDDDTDNDTAPDDRDLDPLVDLEVTVSITEILALDPIDPDDSYAGDFFVKIFIDQVMYGQWSDDDTDNTPDWTNADGVTEWDQDSHKTPDEIGDNLTFTSEGLSDWDTDSQIEIIIVLYDDDQGHSDDDLCDIGISLDWEYITVWYDIHQGTWSGDDCQIDDDTGYGHTCGLEDGISGDDNDCEIFFDIWVDEYTTDNDRISYYNEVNIYNTNPKEWDTDDDGLSDREALFYPVFNPNLYNDPNADTDGDGFLNSYEVNNPFSGIYGLDPTNPDTDNDELNDKIDKNPFIYTNRYALIFGITDFDWAVEIMWGATDLDELYPSAIVEYDLQTIGLQSTLISGRVTFSDFCNGITNFMENNRVISTDTVMLYMYTHGNGDIGYKIAFSDDLYLGDDCLGWDGIEPEIERLGPALDYFWLHTCSGWQFKVDGEVDQLANYAEDIVFMGADGVSHGTGTFTLTLTLNDGESVEETINDLQEEVWHSDESGDQYYLANMKCYDLYSGQLFLCNAGVLPWAA